MVWFTGTVLGNAFSSTEAEDPFDLCRKLLPPGTDDDPFPFHQYRMWIQVTTPITGKPLWFDVVLASVDTCYFQRSIREMWDGISELNTIIRRAGEKSPNSSPESAAPGPHPKTPVGKAPPSTPQSSYLEAALSKSMSGLTEKTVDMEIAPSSSSCDTFGASALNEIEPFTREEITSDSTGLIPLHFFKKKNGRVASYEVILVSSDHLELFVKTELGKGKIPTNLYLRSVPCRGGETKHFHLSAQVWFGSIIEHSSAFRKILADAQYSDKAREEQLKELKRLDLYSKVLYWVADMFEVGDENARARLAHRIEAHGVSHFMSPYYFTEVEAKCLNDLCVPGSATSFKTLLNTLAEEDDVCTSHNLAPTVMRVLSLQKDFHKDADFKEKRAKWLKDQKAVWRGSPKGPGGHFFSS